jgi:two-component system response regulator BaeR
MTETPRRIVVVEDDAKIADMLCNYLRAQQWEAVVVGNGLDVAAQVRRKPPSAVLLDLMLPGKDGIEVCRELREFSAVPIVMLTARVDEVDRLLGLDIGADDYICKPFSPREVVARIKALLRRADGRLGQAAPSHGFHVDEAGRRIGWQEHWLPLTPVEFRLLRQLVHRPGHVFSRDRLIDSVYESAHDATDRAIDSHVKNLRRKIAKVRPQGAGIASVYGLGYRFDPDADERGASIVSPH